MRFLLPSLGRLLRETALQIGTSPLPRSRRTDSLRALDDHMLRDIGVGRSATAASTPWLPDSAGIPTGI